MTDRQKRRLWLCAVIFAGVGASTALALTAFQQNLLFFLTPSQVAAGEAPGGRLFRIGGLVSEGSFVQLEGVRAQFAITDLVNEVLVEHEGILPDLFREGQGIVARGQMRPDGVFVAAEVLAKHDENYMPPEAQHALDAARTLKQ